jgi:homoserine dehydrogenase
MRIGLAGLGNVGAGVVRLLHANRDLLKARGVSLTVVAASARNRDKERSCDVSDIEWEDDPRALASRRDVEAVVELIGGAEGAALDVAAETLKHGKHLVTANKDLIAAHGVEMARIAEESGVQLSFEAAVCGGIPVLKTLREGLAGNRIDEIRGILNGTCNFILTRMGSDGADFATALAEAQEHGFAEADPSADIDGRDSANKLAILSAIAFGIVPDVSAISVQGIRKVTLNDIRSAAQRGGAIKLIGHARRVDRSIMQRVKPIFIPFDQMLAGVGGVINAVEISGDFMGDLMLQGAGAGGDATASAVVADLIDIARGLRCPSFGRPAASLVSLTPAQRANVG